MGIRIYTDGSATDAIQDGGTGSIIYLSNGDTLESATATGKHCTNYTAEVKALSHGAHSILDIVGNHISSCIISLNSMVLRSDELQFAYKKSCSAIQCVSMIADVINYYGHNVSSVYMCMLDASKAFDRVNLLTLFKTLYSRGMFPIYLRLLMKIYEEQNMRIRWNSTVTDYFTISNGVKQGGILSPILFSLYLDQLISRLRHIGMGCHMNGLFTRVFIYADGITLLAPSRAILALKLEQCDNFSRTRGIVFNVLKTK